jgi:hypothetical protein
MAEKVAWSAGPPPADARWHRNPFAFKSFEIGVAKLLEALEPQGDIHPPQFDSILKQVFDQFENSGIVVETKLKEQMANDAKTVAASFESPTALGESAARQTLADLLGFGSAPDELKEWTSSLPKPADYAALKQAERTWYGMDDVRRGLD